MEHTHKVKLKPFSIPNFVIPDQPPVTRGSGFQPVPSIPIEQLEEATLESLCVRFVWDIYQKAGKTPPTNLQILHKC